MRAVAVGGVEGAVGRAAESVVIPLVLDGDDVLGLDLVGLAAIQRGIGCLLLLGQAAAAAASGSARPSFSGAGS